MWPVVATLGPLIWGLTCDPGRTVESYLGRTVFELAEVPFSTYGFDGTVTEIRCVDLRVGALSSARLGPRLPSVLLSGSGIAVSCTGKYAFEQSFFGWPYGSGDLAIESAGSSIRAVMTAVAVGERGLVGDVRMDDCEPSVVLTSMTFSGGLSASLLSLFTGVIKPAVADMVGPALCAFARRQLVGLDLPAVFARVAEVLEPHFTRPLPTAPTPDPTAYAWSEVALGRAASELNRALTDPNSIDLRQAMRALGGALGARSDGRLGLGTAVEVDMLLPGLSGARLRARNASLGALDSISRLQLARPAAEPAADGIILDAEASSVANRTGLVLELAFDRIELSAELLVEHDALELCGSAAVEARANSLKVSAVAQVPLLPSALDSIAALELVAAPAEALPRALSCLLASVDTAALALVRLQVGLGSVELSLAGLSPDGLWPQLVGGVDLVAEVALDHFGGAMLRAAEGAIAGPLGTLLQAELSSLLRAAADGEACLPDGAGLPPPPWPEAPTGSLAWANSSAARIATEAFNALLARADGSGDREASQPNGAPLIDPNKLVRALSHGRPSLELMPSWLPAVHTNLTLGELATLRFGMTELGIEGLDSISWLEIVPASPSHGSGAGGHGGAHGGSGEHAAPGEDESWGAEASAFVVTVGLDRLAVSANLSLTALASDLLAGVFAADSLEWLLIDGGQASVALAGVSATMLVRLPLAEARVKNLTMAELLSAAGLQCVLGAIDSAEIRLLGAHVGFARIEGVELQMRQRPLWAAISTVINLGLSACLRAAEPSLRRLLDAAAKGPALGVLDTALRDAALGLIGDAACADELASSNDGGGATSVEEEQSIAGKLSIAPFVQVIQSYLSSLGEDLPALANEATRALFGGEGTLSGGPFSRALVADFALPYCLGNLNVSVDAYSIAGLDTFSRLALESVPTQNQSARLGVTLETISGAVDLRIVVVPPSVGTSDDGVDCMRRRRRLGMLEGGADGVVAADAGSAVRNAAAEEPFELALTLSAAVDGLSADTTLLLEISDGSSSPADGNTSETLGGNGGGWTLGDLFMPAPCRSAFDNALPTNLSTGGSDAQNATGDGSSASPQSSTSESPLFRARLTSFQLGGVVTSARAVQITSTADGTSPAPSAKATEGDARAAQAASAADTALRSLAAAYGAQLLPALGATLLRLERTEGLVDGALGAFFGSTDTGACAPPPFIRPDGLIEWSTYPPVQLLDFVSHDLLGVGGANAVIRALTESQSAVAGGLSYEGEVLTGGANLGDQLGIVDFSVGSPRLLNADTISNLELLKPLSGQPSPLQHDGSRRLLAGVGPRRTWDSRQERRLDSDDDAPPAALGSSITIGGEGKRALSASAHTRIQFEGSAASFALALRLALELTRLALAFTLDARVDAQRLHAIEVSSLLDGSGWICMGASVAEQGLRISSASAKVGSVRPVASELWAVGSASDDGAPLSLEPIERAFAELGDGLTLLVNDALEYVLPEIAMPMLNSALDESVLDWRSRCDTGKAYEAPPSAEQEALVESNAMQLATVISLIVFCSLLGLCCVAYAWWWARWRRRTKPERMAGLPTSAISAAAKAPAADRVSHGDASAHRAVDIVPAPASTAIADITIEVNGALASKRCHAALSRACARAFSTSLAADVRLSIAIAVTICIFAVIALFVWTNLQVCAHVALAFCLFAAPPALRTMNVTPPAPSIRPQNPRYTQVNAELVIFVESAVGLEIQPPPLYQVSLGGIIHDMSQAGPTPVAVVIVLLSGVWPFLKLLGILVCWLAPSTVLPPNHREAILHMLHAHGKWSLVDVAIIQLAMVAFNLTLSLPAEWLGGISLLTVSAYILPAAGLYGLLFGTLVSIFLSHVVLAYHVSLRDAKRNASSPIGDEKGSASLDGGKLYDAGERRATRDCGERGSGGDEPVGSRLEEGANEPSKAVAALRDTHNTAGAAQGDSGGVGIGSRSSKDVEPLAGNSPAPPWRAWIGRLGTVLKAHTAGNTIKPAGAAGPAVVRLSSSTDATANTALGPVAPSSESSPKPPARAAAGGSADALVPAKVAPSSPPHSASLLGAAAGDNSYWQHGDGAHMHGGGTEGKPRQVWLWQPLYRFAVTETRLERTKLALALLGLPCSVSMAVWGSLVDSFKFEITGLAGLLISAGGKAGSRSFSLLDLGLALGAAMTPASAFGKNTLIAEFLLLHFVMPVALPFAVALLWALPLPLRLQKHCYLVVQLVNAVSGIDIFMLALAVGLSELERLGQFLLKGRCDELNKLLEIYALELLNGDARCFSVTAGLEKGYWVLLTAAIVSFLASRLILRRCELALDRRSARAHAESHDTSLAAAAVAGFTAGGAGLLPAVDEGAVSAAAVHHGHSASVAAAGTAGLISPGSSASTLPEPVRYKKGGFAGGVAAGLASFVQQWTPSWSLSWAAPFGSELGSAAGVAASANEPTT